MTTSERAEAWVQLPTDESLAASRAKGTHYDVDFVPNMGRLLAAHGRIGSTFARLFGVIMFVPGVLDRREKEMIATVAAAAQDCHY